MAYFPGHGQQVKNPCPILHITVTAKMACTSVYVLIQFLLILNLHHPRMSYGVFKL